MHILVSLLEWLAIIAGVLFGVVGPCVLYVYLLITKAELFFSPMGRIKRMTFWEGLTAWFLLNSFPMIVIIMSMMYSVTPLTEYFGDTDLSIYANLHIALLFMEWVFASWTLAAICAKRWHDLNFTGWLAAFNIIPVVVFGIVLLGFFTSIQHMMVYRFTTDANAMSPGVNFFEYVARGKAIFDRSFIETSPMVVTFTFLIVGGAFLFPGIIKGTSGGNAYGKNGA